MVDQLRQGIVELYEHYKRVYAFISQCQGRERPTWVRMPIAPRMRWSICERSSKSSCELSEFL